MAERSFAREVERLRLGAGETFRGEGILAITKALLQCGVGYVGGYQGAPISHLMDVLADAQPILDELGVRFESNASEAAAAAMLAASVHYPIRGAVTFKSTVGTNVASDALANLASGGVLGGALIIVGEDYGEGSSIMQERSHAFAMKSQIWLLDPRPNLPSIVRAVAHGFALSEASNTPVMLEVRIRACHVHGSFVAEDNRRPSLSVRDALERPRRDTGRIVLPPASFLHEREKRERRWPAAVGYIIEHTLNERFGPATCGVGIVLQGGMYNGVVRALQRLGLADGHGETALALYVLNVTYPLLDEEFLAFCEGRDAVLVVEEGQPDFIEQGLRAVLHKAGRTLVLAGKDVLPMAGEYTGQVMLAGIEAFLARHAPALLPTVAARADGAADGGAGDGENAAAVGTAGAAAQAAAALAPLVPSRPPGFCVGCPERPIFAALKLVEDETGPHQVAADIGCHLFSILPPFEIGGTTMGYGLGPASNAAFDGGGRTRPISILGDGGFWHNGLTSSVGNAVFNESDGVTIIVDNFYSAATGGQDILSSRADNPSRRTKHPIARAVEGVGARWVREVDHTYDVETMRRTLREALTTTHRGPKIIVASSECMLNRQRRERPLVARAITAGTRVVTPRFGVDEDVCTGDHACMRLSGCPSLTLKRLDDPLREDPVATIDRSCVGCGHCGDVAEAAALCPAFHRADVVHNPSRLERLVARVRARVIGALQAWRAGARLQIERPESRAAAGPSVTGGAVDRAAVLAAGAAHGDILKLAILAVGGQGGGVLTDWIVALAERNGYAVQATSVAGVAQRTGATIYYVEMSPAGERELVFSLSPTPGDVDILIAAELMEAGRAIVRGFVTPDRTTLIASTHRMLATSEKIAPGDAIADPDAVLAAARERSARLLAFDMERVAVEAGSVISASLLGALAGAGSLPFEPDSWEATIAASGRDVAASLRAFRAARERALAPGDDAGPAAHYGPAPGAASPEATSESDLGARRDAFTRAAPPALVGPERLGVRWRALQSRARELPAPVAALALHGLAKVVDFQDVDYGAEYLDRIERVVDLDATAGGAPSTWRLSVAAARHVANAMVYDDLIRVADRKTRRDRFERIAREAELEDGSLLSITEFMHPGARELCSLLPARLGRALEARPRAFAALDRLVNRGRRFRSDGIFWFTALFAIGGLRRVRRRLLRHAVEIEHRERWLRRSLAMANGDYDVAVRMLEARRLVKGYGDTHARGLSKFERVMRGLERAARTADARRWSARLLDDALADVRGDRLDETARSLDASLQADETGIEDTLSRAPTARGGAERTPSRVQP